MTPMNCLLGSANLALTSFSESAWDNRSSETLILTIYFDMPL